MDTPIDTLHAGTPCRAGAPPDDTWSTWQRALLRLFADMACRLR